ncbi:MFS transporter [Verrucomicrobium sp. BvORR106]|uniref:MFS transporter n=1 Tax=Verrucomicrobium sp. BvORR106 TaxID=1403819 RepID=UPI0007C72CFB|nr:MFS transporter [Verrucomicrobium sp. BvORR106]
MTSSSTARTADVLHRSTLWMMAAACGASAANIFYNQPLLGKFALAYQASPSKAGLVATAAQVGYGLGLFLFVPLGDLLNRRKVVLLLMSLCTALLAATAAAPGLQTLIWLHLLIGITTMNAQILIPFGMELSPPKERGRTVGVLMAGLLCGVLLARVVSGFVGEHIGWRTVYLLATGVMLVILVSLYRGLPHRPPVAAHMGYGRFMKEMFQLWARLPALWTASAVSGLSFGCFTAFWTTLSFLLMDRFGMGASAAGAFGVIGLAGVLAAPLAGRVSDRRGPRFTVTVSLLLIALSFVGMSLWLSLPMLVLGVIFMDLGVQAIQVAAQTRVMSLVPDAGSRLNTFYMVFRFVGGALGSFLGATAWAHWQWAGVCCVAVGLVLAALVVHALDRGGR